MDFRARRHENWSSKSLRIVLSGALRALSGLERRFLTRLEFRALENCPFQHVWNFRCSGVSPFESGGVQGSRALAFLAGWEFAGGREWWRKAALGECASVLPSRPRAGRDPCLGTSMELATDSTDDTDDTDGESGSTSGRERSLRNGRTPPLRQGPANPCHPSGSGHPLSAECQYIVSFDPVAFYSVREA